MDKSLEHAPIIALHFLFERLYMQERNLSRSSIASDGATGNSNFTAISSLSAVASTTATLSKLLLGF